jgi:hypothetical protein
VTTARKRKRKRGSARRPLPFGLRTNGQFASIEEVIDRRVGTIPLGLMESTDRVRLVMERLRRTNERIGIAGRGYMSAQEAADEIQRGTRLAVLIMDIHERVIHREIERRLAGPQRRRRK